MLQIRLQVRRRGARLRPHRGAAREKQRQQREAVQIDRSCEVLVEDEIGVGPQIAAPQIHEKEGDVVEHIDARDVVVELHGVEQGGNAVDQADVPQVEIAVALAHRSPALPGVKAIAVTLERGAGVHGQTLAGRRFQDSRALLDEAARVALDDPRHARLPAMFRTRLRAPVQADDRVGQAFHEPGVQLTTLGQAIEERVLVEADHLDQPINRRARPADRERPTVFPSDGTHSQVQRGGGAAVEAHFGLAGGVSQLDRRKIHVVEPNGPFELVGPIARQPHDADVRVDAFDLECGITVGLRRGEKRHDIALIVGSHGSGGPHSGSPLSSRCFKTRSTVDASFLKRRSMNARTSPPKNPPTTSTSDRLTYAR